MEVDRMQCKFPRISRNGNGRLGSGGNEIGEDQYQDEEEDGERKEVTAGGVDIRGAVGRFYGWPSSRIVRVSRASGGKDRHSKVLTSKGLRDRRVRLSVNTAIQFYDLQDRLGYDQPSKAVEWLLKAAATSIAELPPMNTSFPDTPRQVSDEKRSSTGGSDQLGFDLAEADMDGCGGHPSYIQKIPATKSSACSSNSENSKNSGLSLSRSKKSVAEKKKEKDQIESSQAGDSLNPISQTTSFTELLNGALHNVRDLDNHTSVSPNSSVRQTPNRYGGNSNQSNFFLKSSSDIFSGGLLGMPAPQSRQMQLVNALRPMFTLAGEHQSEIQTLSSAPDHFSVANTAGGGNNSNSNHHHGFTISSSSGLPGFDRGTLQSNTSPSSSLLPTPQDGSPPSFFIGAAPLENQHHHFLSGLDLYGQKGKGKK